MTRLRKTILTDSDVIDWLKPFVERGEATIINRRTGGLDVDVTYRSAFKEYNDYHRVKTFLRTNGFFSRVGVHSRNRVDKPTRSENFTVARLIDEKTADMFMSVLNNI